jgi:hypothetical protein
MISFYNLLVWRTENLVRTDQGAAVTLKITKFNPMQNTSKCLKQLIQHMRWANEQVLDSLKETSVDDANRLFTHILTTEELYYLRINGQDPWPQNF